MGRRGDTIHYLNCLDMKRMTPMFYDLTTNTIIFDLKYFIGCSIKKENVSNLARNLFSFHHGLSLQAVLQVSLFLLFGWIEQRAHWVPRTTPLPAPCIVTQIQLWLLVYQTSVPSKAGNFKHPYSVVQKFTTSTCGASVAISCLCIDHMKGVSKNKIKVAFQFWHTSDHNCSDWRNINLNYCLPGLISEEWCQTPRQLLQWKCFLQFLPPAHWLPSDKKYKVVINKIALNFTWRLTNFCPSFRAVLNRLTEEEKL